MSATLTVDAEGNLFLPAAFLQFTKLGANAKVKIEPRGDSVVLQPVDESQAEGAEESGVRMVKKGNMLVLEGFPASIDIVAAIKADREERDEKIARTVTGR